MRSILRAKHIHGAGNPLPVGHSKFYQDFVLHSEDDPYVPGTSIPRLRPVPLGENAVGYYSDELAALIDALGELPKPKKIIQATRDRRKPRGRRAAARYAREEAVS